MMKSDPAARVVVKAEPASAVPTGSVFGRLRAAREVRNWAEKRVSLRADLQAEVALPKPSAGRGS